MNFEKIKGISCAVFTCIFLAVLVFFILNDAGPDTISLMKGDDYIYYDAKQIPLILILPSMIYGDVMCFSLAVPYGSKIFILLLKILKPVLLYTCVAFVIGIVLSVVVAFYPLGTDYYKCDSTSIVSSGSHYAKSKEICKQRAYSPGGESGTKK